MSLMNNENQPKWLGFLFSNQKNEVDEGIQDGISTGETKIPQVEEKKGCDCKEKLR